MFRKLTFIILCSLLFSCAEEVQKTIPKDVFSKEKMAAVLLDMHLMEANMSLNAYNLSIPANNKIVIGFDVFQKHKITKKQYNESFEYYSLNPEQLTEVYQLVLEELSKMQAEVASRKEEKKVKTDSITPNPPKVEKRLKNFKQK